MHCLVPIFVCMRMWLRFATAFAGLAGLLLQLPATTLERLTLEEMSQKSTSVVRARVTGSHAKYRGTDIYTYVQLQVSETWKSAGHAVTEVAVPGGAVNGIRQIAAGAPELKTGQEYVLFLWTSRSGLTQITGLSQGVFNISKDASGEALAQRPAASELMLDRSGHPVTDGVLSLDARDLHARVLRALGAAK